MPPKKDDKGKAPEEAPAPEPTQVRASWLSVLPRHAHMMPVRMDAGVIACDESPIADAFRSRVDASQLRSRTNPAIYSSSPCTARASCQKYFHDGYVHSSSPAIRMLTSHSMTLDSWPADTEWGVVRTEHASGPAELQAGVSGPAEVYPGWD